MQRDAPLSGDWVLWRDFAVRSAGFAVDGLDVFGPGDEPARLREVARDPLFREAVTWQNPAALANAVDRIASGEPSKPSRTRQREEIVASYWQRYSAKTDTIGFFGPLAWGTIADDGPPLRVRSGALVAERAVHLEAWGVQALAATLDAELKIAAGPHAEDDLRAALEAHADAPVRDRGLAALAQLEAARDAVAAASPATLRDALAALDATFVELTGIEPFRNAGRAYGARTLSYVDCMRDLDVTLGPDLIADLAPALHVLFQASRWYCGRVHAIGRAVVERALPAGGSGPFVPVLMRVLPALMALPPEVADVTAELQRRLAVVLDDPDPATLAPRAATMFADHEPAWPTSCYDSVDVQLAAASAAAVAAGDYLAVIGDVHPGNNPLIQGVFAHRHPDVPRLLRRFCEDAGSGVPLLLPPWGPGMGVDARGVALTPTDWIHIAGTPDTRAMAPRHTWLAHELRVHDGDLVDASGELRVPLVDVFGLPIFVMGVRSFELLPDEPHAPRLEIGRCVLRRESWSVPASELPQHAGELAAFARDRGMPRRVFAKSPLERKPMYVDVESPVLGRILCRHARRAAADSPDARMSFSEMLPLPEQCWLADPGGRRYVAELRLVALDDSRR